MDTTESLGAPYITSFLKGGGRSIPVVSTRLSLRDRLEGIKVRWGFGRSGFRVAPGLYAVGKPGPGAPVLVTANYKLTFDRLRRELAAVDAWILVLDTRGINVWCAAGKGTFGTRELLDRIAAVRLDEVVFRPRLILPQLGAPGVSAPEVKKATGWTQASA
jgi:CO dehydrogenase/acetyl-CoA synthase gamma subunit (corrinoid Fe-S protein)